MKENSGKKYSSAVIRIQTKPVRRMLRNPRTFMAYRKIGILNTMLLSHSGNSFPKYVADTDLAMMDRPDTPPVTSPDGS